MNWWWAKFDAGFAEAMTRAGVSDAAFRTHVEANMWAYRNDGTLVIPRRLLSRVANTSDPEDAAVELCDLGLWAQTPAGWLIVHHADVIQESIDAQEARRKSNREAQAARRGRVRALRAVSADVSADSALTNDGRAE